MMGCPSPPPQVAYRIYIYYKNRGGDMLDPKANVYKRSDITINGETTDFSIELIDSARYNGRLRQGYALSFILPSGVNATGRDATFLIRLQPSDTDTLVSRNSGESLVSCTYNGVNVLPSPLSSPLFPVVVVKKK
jgi:hypothetical protein